MGFVTRFFRWQNLSMFLDHVSDTYKYHELAGSH